MSDSELIVAVCELWHKFGGDAEGFLWNWRTIYDELLRLEREAEREWKRPAAMAGAE